MLENEEKMEIDGIAMSKDTLFFGTIFKMDEMAKLARKCIDEIERSDNARIIVLEAWLFIDFCVRELLMSGLELTKLDVDAFDLRVHLLPKSFRECIRLVVDLKKAHANLPRDPREIGIRMSTRFLVFLNKRRPDLCDQLGSVVEEYYHQYVPGLASNEARSTMLFLGPPPDKQGQYTRISEDWLELVKRIDDAWIRRADRLNDARNCAAHAYDPASILERMGYSGPSAAAHLKQECIALVRDLTGIAKSP